MDNFFAMVVELVVLVHLWTCLTPPILPKTSCLLHSPSRLKNSVPKPKSERRRWATRVHHARARKRVIVSSHDLLLPDHPRVGDLMTRSIEATGAYSGTTKNLVALPVLPTSQVLRYAKRHRAQLR